MGNISNAQRRLVYISGQRPEKGLKFIATLDNHSVDYNEILSLVATSIGDNNTGFPGNLVVEILCKLPVRSLIRYKAVCMSWKLLINSSVFVYKHLHRPNPQRGNYSVEFIFPILHRDRARFRLGRFEVRHVVGHCNGIVCLQPYSNGKYIILSNPSTREFSILPRRLCADGFAGFCYLPRTRKYQITFIDDRSGRQADITTLTLGKIPALRVVKNVSMLCVRRIDSRRTVTCGTTMYFVGSNHQGREVVICYDMIEGRFSKIDVPPRQSFSREGHRRLSLLKDSVIMCVSSFDHTFFHIWMLVDDVTNGKSWMKYRKVGPFDLVKSIYPVGFCWNYSWILVSVVFVKGNDLPRYDNWYYYHLETGQIKDYNEYLQIKELLVTNIMESLVPISSLVPFVNHEDF